MWTSWIYKCKYVDQSTISTTKNIGAATYLAGVLSVLSGSLIPRLVIGIKPHPTKNDMCLRLSILNDHMIKRKNKAVQKCLNQQLSTKMTFNLGKLIHNCTRPPRFFKAFSKSISRAQLEKFTFGWRCRSKLQLQDMISPRTPKHAPPVFQVSLRNKQKYIIGANYWSKWANKWWMKITINNHLSHDQRALIFYKILNV